MNDEEARLSSILCRVVTDVPAPSGAKLRAVARKRYSFRGRLVIGSAAVACLALVVGIGVVTRDRGEVVRPAATKRYTWGVETFDYPAAWFTLDLHVQSRGRVGFGPYLSNAPLKHPCADANRECGPIVESLEPGQVLAQWRLLSGPGLHMSRQPGMQERRGDGRLLKSHDRPAQGECRSIGGTRSIDLYVAASDRGKPYNLHACLNDTPTSAMPETLRAIALSLDWPIND